MTPERHHPIVMHWQAFHRLLRVLTIIETDIARKQVIIFLRGVPRHPLKRGAPRPGPHKVGETFVGRVQTQHIDHMARCVSLDRLVYPVFQNARRPAKQVHLARTVCQDSGDPRFRRHPESLNVVAEREVVHFDEYAKYIECVLFPSLVLIV